MLIVMVMLSVALACACSDASRRTHAGDDLDLSTTPRADAGPEAGPDTGPEAPVVEVSFGRVEITPAVGASLGGYAVDAARPSSGTRVPLYARGIVFWDGGSPKVIVTADLIGVDRAMHQDIRSRVLALGALRSTSDFVLTATHTHNGPALPGGIDPVIAYNLDAAQLGAVRAYGAWVADQIVRLVETTLAKPHLPCTLDYQVARAGFSYNREGLSAVEEDVPILVARSPAGAPLAILFGYGAHPVAAGYETLADADYPGRAIAAIEGSTGAFAQFILGAAGDQNPAGDQGFDLADALGTSLGNLVSQAAGTAGREVAAPIRTAYSELSLPLDITETPDSLGLARAYFAERRDDPSQPGYLRRHAQVMVDELDAQTFAKAVPLPIQRWVASGSAGLKLLFIGGEPVASYAATLRKRDGGSNGVWVSGYANEVPAYVPSDELLTGGGALHYACGWSADHPGIAGGAMAIYGKLGHFVQQPADNSYDGVEQTVLKGVTALQ
jgi:hypothetical protein